MLFKSLRLFAILYLQYIGVKSENQSRITTLLTESTLAEDGKLNFTELANKYGHKAEEYDVVTEDGYILKMFYIPGKKPPVLLVHGIADTSDTFITRGNRSLAITLANADYPVFAGNCRGNKYSRRHETLDPDNDKEFWDYSFHEMGYYDLPAMIDFAREKSGEDTISTIAHSQGTTMHYVLGSLRPEYNERVKVMIALAPIAFLNNLGAPTSLVALAGPAILKVIEELGIEELLQDRKALSDLITIICSKGVVSYAICGLGVLLPFAGFDPTAIDPEFLRVAIGHYPAALSRKALSHFDQLFLRRSFSQYDYGLTENLDKYGTISPPDYNLGAVNMKVALLVGKNDELSRAKDAEHLRDSLPNVVDYEVLEPALWNHIDFVCGPNMTEYLFPSIFKVLEKYT